MLHHSRTRLLALALALTAASVPRTADCRQEPADPPPVSVFADLEGTWSGVFVGYDAKGVELYRIRVRQTYTTIDETRQKVAVEDVMPDGERITGEGWNTCEVGADGARVLRCVVEKSNGDRVEHTGRIVRGPSGAEELIWHTDQPERVETFRERVRREGDEVVYSIDGMGRYGDLTVLMAGRYVRQ